MAGGFLKFPKRRVGFRHRLLPVDIPGKNETKVGKTVEIAENLRIDLFEPGQGYAVAFRASSHGASQMQMGAGRRAAGQNELFQRRKAVPQRINFALQPADFFIPELRALRGGSFRSGELRSNGEKVVCTSPRTASSRSGSAWQRTTPSRAFSSSRDPQASMAGESFGTRFPPINPVFPSSPVLV